MKEQLTRLSVADLQLSPDNACSTLDYLLSYGKTEQFQTPKGNLVTLLPTCEVASNCLIPENWAQKLSLGNTRFVQSIEKLKDGIKPEIIVKGPERIFTREEALLAKGIIWYGGRYSGEKGILIENSSVVEEQTLWEAIILLKLNKQGLHAEKPQALITFPNGKNALVVKEIKSAPHHTSLLSPSYSAQLAKARTLGFVPEDSSFYNCIRSIDGTHVIIDVNRWQWPPFTTPYRETLLQTVRKEIPNWR